jgi:hypothetical protein
MPEKETIRRAQKDKREGKAASTQAGEFIREEMHHIREGKHGARSRKQAIAIGLSKARRAGVKLAPKGRGKARKSAARARKKGGRTIHAYRTNPRRAAGARRALKRAGRPRLRGRAARQMARKAARTRARRGTQWRGGRNRKKK